MTRADNYRAIYRAQALCADVLWRWHDLPQENRDIAMRDCDARPAECAAVYRAILRSLIPR